MQAGRRDFKNYVYCAQTICKLSWFNSILRNSQTLCKAYWHLSNNKKKKHLNGEFSHKQIFILKLKYYLQGKWSRNTEGEMSISLKFSLLAMIALYGGSVAWAPQPLRSGKLIPLCFRIRWIIKPGRKSSGGSPGDLLTDEGTASKNRDTGSLTGFSSGTKELIISCVILLWFSRLVWDSLSRKA